MAVPPHHYERIGTNFAYHCLIMNRSRYDKWLVGIPPIIIVGAVVVLLPIFTLMTMQTITRQKENSIRLLSEKGAALIRSFEAGTRTGMMGHWRSAFKLQRLIMETAQQPDIDYILVTDAGGIIRAANDPKILGKTHGTGLDLTSIGSSKAVQWRMVPAGPHGNLFEVFRRFSPLKRPWKGRGAAGRPGMMHQRWGQFLPEMEGSEEPEKLTIFIGLDMSSIETANKADTRHTIIMGIVLLVVGFTGMMLIFLVQGYRQTRTSLSRIRAFSDQVVENMPIGLIAVDRENRIVSFNQTAGSIIGMAPETVLGSPAQAGLPPDLTKHLTDSDTRVDSLEREMDCLMLSGDTVPLALSISGLHDDSGTCLGSLLLIKDLREVRALQKEVVRSQRMATVGKLAAGVAHEIRNPLSSIKGFATYFKEKYQNDREDQQIAAIMIQEVDRLNRVVSQLLEFARPVSLNIKPVNIDPLIENSLELARRQAEEKKIRIEYRVHKNNFEVPADQDRLNQVFLNLYLNSIDAMTSGGVLGVEIDEAPFNRGIWIRVSDTGTGISTADIPHVFDPYYTTKPTGTGLGLAIAHNIIEAHGGQIKAESRAGKETVMSIFLPYGEKSH